jgi:hypothetical protein
MRSTAAGLVGIGLGGRAIVGIGSGLGILDLDLELEGVTPRGGIPSPHLLPQLKQLDLLIIL